MLLKKYPMFQGFVSIFCNPPNTMARQKSSIRRLSNLVLSVCYIIYNLLIIDCIYIQKQNLTGIRLFTELYWLNTINYVITFKTYASIMFTLLAYSLSAARFNVFWSIAVSAGVL